MVMKHEGRGEGFCCRYASAGSLIGWFMYDEDKQNVIFVESSDSSDFIQTINKATTDLQERMGAEKRFVNNALKAMCDAGKDDTPHIFAGSLSDEELISFLEDVIVKLMSRRNLTGKPESLREQAGQAEEKLKSTNEFINSIVYRQVRNPNLNP
ncbi:hypothetical protein ABHD31_09660 [Enterobacter cloacae]|uniref:hypothetical protein n=1 Tax=Enterobacter cloacae TaxID=550 RepID=UPI00325BAB4F